MLRSPSGPARAAAAAVGIAVIITLLDLGPGFDLTTYLRVGEQASAREFVQADLPDTHLVPGWGHDGQANYVLSRTLPDLSGAEGHLDSVTYRARRIVYPALTAPLPDGTPVVVAFWAINLAAIGLAAAAVAHLAQRHGAGWLAGAAVGLSPAFLTSMIVHLGDALGLGLAAAGIAAWRRPDATRTAIALFTIAALTRETTLLIPAAVFLCEGGRRRWTLLIAPAALLGWMAILQIWIGDAGKSAAQFRPPFMGWVTQGLGTLEVTVALAFVLASLWAASRLRRVDATLALILLFDVAVLTVVDRDVLFDVRNLSRVVPWTIPLLVLALDLAWRSHRARPAVSPQPANTSSSVSPQPANTHSVVKVTPASTVLCTGQRFAMSANFIRASSSKSPSM